MGVDEGWMRRIIWLEDYLIDIALCAILIKLKYIKPNIIYYTTPNQRYTNPTIY